VKDDGRRGRGHRLAFVTRLLTGRPGELINLSYFAEILGAAKSTISEDLGIIKESLEEHGLGVVETVAGAAGGVVFHPAVPLASGDEMIRELCARLREPERILPGGFVNMTDIVFSPQWSARLGDLMAGLFGPAAPEYILTVETKGIPLALFSARALNVPLVVARRDAVVTEGPAVSITFVSGSTGRIQAMSLPRRSLPPGARVLLVDDFMKAGGTARGMVELMREFEATVVGIAVLVATARPERKLVDDYVAFAVLHEVDEHARRVTVVPGNWHVERCPPPL
jgi:purine operon repressor